VCDLKIILEPVELTKEQKFFLMENEITFGGFKKIFEKKSKFYPDECDLLVMDYLSKKIMMLRLMKKNLENYIKSYNDSVEMAKKLGIKKNIKGDPLKTAELNYKEVAVKWF